jgi:hypothetical protein
MFYPVGQHYTQCYTYSFLGPALLVLLLLLAYLSQGNHCVLTHVRSTFLTWLVLALRGQDNGKGTGRAPNYMRPSRTLFITGLSRKGVVLSKLRAATFAIAPKNLTVQILPQVPP